MFAPIKPLLNSSSSTDSTVRFWETQTWQSAGVIPVNPGLTGSELLTWNAAGDGLILASADSTFREFDAATGAVRWTLLAVDEQSFAMIAPDGEIQQMEGLDDELVVVIEDANGQSMLTPTEFAARRKAVIAKLAPIGAGR